MNIVRHVVVHGRVQGVGFRAFVEDMAERLDLEGWVRNRRGGVVEAVFAGPEQAVAAAIEACRTGPRSARVTDIDVTEGEGLLRQPQSGRFAVLPTA
jgi:acylphosphatase